MAAPTIDYSQYLFKGGATGVYSLVGGVARPITDTASIDPSLLANLQTKTFGQDSAGYTAQGGGGTTGGGQDFNTFKSNVYAMDPNVRSTIDTYNNANPTNGVNYAPSFNGVSGAANPFPNSAPPTSATPNQPVSSNAPSATSVFGDPSKRIANPTLNTAPVASQNPGGLPSSADKPITSAKSPGAGYIQGYDTNNGYAPVWVKAGAYYPGISLYPQNSNTITPNSLQKASPVVVPPITGGTATTTKAVLAGGAQTSQNIDDLIKSYTASKTTEQTEATDWTNNLLKLLPEEAGQSAALAAELAKPGGADDLTTQLTSANNQLKTLQAEAEALKTDQEGKPVTMNTIIGADAQIAARYNSQILTQTAVISALTGDLTAAKDAAQKAVDAKYQPIAEQISIYQAQLAAIQPTLDAQEKIQADAIAELKANQKQALDTLQSDIKTAMSDAITKGITDPTVLNQIANAGSGVEALGIVAANVPLSASGDHSPIYKEWQDAVSTGYTGTFTQYENEDANRKRSVTNINSGTTIQNDVNKQNALQNAADAQTVNSNYQTIVSIASKVGKTPDTITEADIKKLSNADLTSIGKALGRMQMPDVARAGGSTSNPLDAVGIVGSAKQAISSALGGQLYNPTQVLDAIKTANSLQGQRQATGLNATTQGQASQSPAKGTDGAAYGFPGYHSDGTQWIKN